MEINSSKSDNVFYILEQTTEAIEQGLLPYLMQTEWSKHLIFEENKESVANPPWNAWLYSLGGTFKLDGAYSWNNAADSVRLTGKLRNSMLNPFFQFDKINQQRHLSASFFYENKLNISTSGTNESKQKEERFAVFLSDKEVLKEKMAYGASISYSRVISQKSRPQGYIRPFIEYNFIPYDQYFQRFLTLQYSLEFDIEKNRTSKLGDSKFTNNLDLTWSKLEKWGRFFLRAGASYRLERVVWNAWGFDGSAYANVYLGKGIFLNPSISYARNNYEYSFLSPNPVYSKGFRYYNFRSSLGITYNFGSQWTPPVNPRIGFYY